MQVYISKISFRLYWWRKESSYNDLKMEKGQRHVKSVRIRSYSGLHFSWIFSHSDWIRRDTSYTSYLSVFSPNAGKCGKNADHNNSEYGHFSLSATNHSNVKRTFMQIWNFVKFTAKNFLIITIKFAIVMEIFLLEICDSSKKCQCFSFFRRIL